MDKIRKRHKQSGSSLVETALIITLIALAFISAGDAFSNSLANSLCLSVGKFRQAELTEINQYAKVCRVEKILRPYLEAMTVRLSG
jgi:Flp pilus assembly pilin Flp